MKAKCSELRRERRSIEEKEASWIYNDGTMGSRDAKRNPRRNQTKHATKESFVKLERSRPDQGPKLIGMAAFLPLPKEERVGMGLRRSAT
jgi:hypothetical protein